MISFDPNKVKIKTNGKTLIEAFKKYPDVFKFEKESKIYSYFIFWGNCTQADATIQLVLLDKIPM